MKNYNDTVGNRTRDLPVCSAVPQPTTSHRAPPPPFGFFLFDFNLNINVLTNFASNLKLHINPFICSRPHWARRDMEKIIVRSFGMFSQTLQERKCIIQLIILSVMRFNIMTSRCYITKSCISHENRYKYVILFM